jgi:hypothetical protein
LTLICTTEGSTFCATAWTVPAGALACVASLSLASELTTLPLPSSSCWSKAHAPP